MGIRFGVDTWTDEITERIAAKIAAANIVPAGEIVDYIGEIEDLLKLPNNDRFIVIAPMNLPVNVASTTGMGAEFTEFDGVYRIDICLRIMERQQRTNRLLSGSSASLPALVKLILQELHVKPLVKDLAAGGDTQAVLIQPMRLISAVYNPRKPASGWAYCRTLWQCYFRTDLS